MAKKSSFDVSTGVDLQEVDNAVNQAHKEIATRYDFKGTDCTLKFDREAATIALDADDAYRLQALRQVLRDKLAKRKVPLRNIDEGTVDIFPDYKDYFLNNPKSPNWTRQLPYASEFDRWCP